jgi:hypothetical protein
MDWVRIWNKGGSVCLRNSFDIDLEKLGESCKINRLGWSLLGRSTDLVSHEYRSESLAVEPAYLVKGIKELKVSLEKGVSNLRPVSLYYVVRGHVHKIYTIKITE